MNKESILNFINDVIIENGIKNNLDSGTIKRSISEYKRYLIENGLADEDIVKAISKIEEKADEYIELAKSFKSAGLQIPRIKLSEQDEKENNSQSGSTDKNVACGDTTLDRIEYLSRRKTQDSCGSILSRGC